MLVMATLDKSSVSNNLSHLVLIRLQSSILSNDWCLLLLLTFVVIIHSKHFLSQETQPVSVGWSVTLRVSEGPLLLLPNHPGQGCHLYGLVFIYINGFESFFLICSFTHLYVH